MRRPPPLIRQLRRDKRGATLMEFGLIVTPLCLFIMGVGDLGYQSYLRSVAQGVLDRAARSASVGTLNTTQIDAYIDSQMQAINSKNGTTSVTKKSYYNFSRVGKPEKITTDTAPLGTYNAGDCFEDSNGNGSYDTESGSTGLGGADDIVFYQVTVSMPRLFPMAKLLGWSATQTATANATIRNQPWSNQVTLPIICK
ncbi:TadE/TadG family type IV pilus assembly protein [Sphingobium yanoikuyae]|uniref:TadE/TadG family type IV pilus assembly protein n=1 Tax=Sphingobium yanoikuyae TaxID=13690 RepID=UPI0004E43D9F|nr:TadE/TadG family type IV pilus assembly protein [Sphingobium yanoikuyae]KFD29064.1 pilus assembly protein TadE [Sphingobium yanoikuyae]KZC81008.1 pilus assembly protein TadE [Sphingobium yanoikuyae]MDV3478880.1 TadE/TadG family type IV pilus assembly protein [Sphingobium yanoikuyae]